MRLPLGLPDLRISALLAIPVAFVLWLTALGGADSGLLLDLVRTPGYDKVAHVVVYGGLTALFITALGDHRVLRFVPFWPALFLVISTVDEFRQITIPGRVFSIDDMIANLIGVTLGWVIGTAILRWTTPTTPTANLSGT